MSKHHFRTWQNCKKLSLRVDILNEAFYKKMSLFFNIQSSPLLLKHIFITFLPRGGMNLIFFFFFFGGGGGGDPMETLECLLRKCLELYIKKSVGSGLVSNAADVHEQFQMARKPQHPHTKFWEEAFCYESDGPLDILCPDTARIKPFHFF